MSKNHPASYGKKWSVYQDSLYGVSQNVIMKRYGCGSGSISRWRKEMGGLCHSDLLEGPDFCKAKVFNTLVLQDVGVRVAIDFSAKGIKLPEGVRQPSSFLNGLRVWAFNKVIMKAAKVLVSNEGFEAVAQWPNAGVTGKTFIPWSAVRYICADEHTESKMHTWACGDEIVGKQKMIGAVVPPWSQDISSTEVEAKPQKSLSEHIKRKRAEFAAAAVGELPDPEDQVAQEEEKEEVRLAGPDTFMARAVMELIPTEDYEGMSLQFLVKFFAAQRLVKQALLENKVTFGDVADKATDLRAIDRATKVRSLILSGDKKFSDFNEDTLKSMLARMVVQ